jgi:hypothetical protein
VVQVSYSIIDGIDEDGKVYFLFLRQAQRIAAAFFAGSWLGNQFSRVSRL